MSKILLIRTKSEKYTHPYGAPPMGLLYLSAVLRQKAHDVKVLDMRAYMLTPQDVVTECSEYQPDFIGVSNFTVEVDCLHKVTGALKTLNAQIPIIVGGPHVNTSPENVLKDANIDYLVLGEGEVTFPTLIEALSSGGKDLRRVQGIVFRADGQVVKTPPRDFIEDLDQIPLPDWDAVELKKYFSLPRFMPFIPHSGKPYLPVTTSRGCPFRCTYCHNILGKKFRARSPQNIFFELRSAYEKYGVADFEFIDDCFNLDKKRVIDLCDLIIRSGMKLELSFPNGLRGDVLDETVVQKLHEAGTKIISFAPETGSARLQKVIKKNVNLEKLQQMISCAAGLGIHTHGFFMLGFPSETEDDLKQSLDFISRTKLHTADFFIVNLFPQTEIYEDVKAQGGQVPEEFAEIDYHDTNFNASEISSEALVQWQRKLFLKFYASPSRIYRIFFHSKAIKKRYLFYYLKIFLRRVVSRKRES